MGTSAAWAPDLRRHLEQVGIGAVVLHLGDTDPAHLVAGLLQGDFFGHLQRREQGPVHPDEAVLLRQAGPLPGQTAVAAVGEAALGIILQKVDATAMGALNAARLQVQFNGRRHTDAHVIGTDPVGGLYVGQRHGAGCHPMISFIVSLRLVPGPVVMTR